MSKEIMQQALTVLKAWDALIKYQYGGSSEAMTAMQNVAWRTLDTIEGLEAALAQPEQEFYPDWDMIQPFHERIKELEIELAKFAPVGEIRSSVWAGHNWAHHFNAEQKLDFKTKLYIKLEHENE